MTLRAVFRAGADYLAQDFASDAPPALIAPWLSAGSIALLFGMPSAGKSMLVTTLIHALAQGVPLWGVFPTRRARVLVVQADMTAALYQERLKPSGAVDGDVAFLLTDAFPFDVRALTGLETPIAEARAFAPDVVFVDTLRKTHNDDENDSAAVDRVYAAWRALFPGAALIFLHHSRKVSMTAASADSIVREAFRGSSAWAASADTLMMIRRVRRANNPDWMTRLFFVRTRSCQEPAPLLLKLTETLLLTPVAEQPLERLLFAWIAANPRAPRAEGVKWLQTQKDDTGRTCSQATAYRVWDRVTKGDA